MLVVTADCADRSECPLQLELPDWGLLHAGGTPFATEAFARPIRAAEPVPSNVLQCLAGHSHDIVAFVATVLDLILQTNVHTELI